MSLWCLQFFRKMNLKTLIFAPAYWGRNFSFVFWKNWKHKSPFEINRPIKAKRYVLDAQRENNGWNFDNLYIDQIIKFVKEENTSAEPLNFETYMKKLQEAYVKEVIVLFNLNPGHLDSTPEYFCDAFGLCRFLTKTIISDTTPESKITAGEI